MKTLEYVGRHDEVELDNGLTCARGETIEVPKDLAAALLRQPGNWKEAAKPRKDND